MKTILCLIDTLGPGGAQRQLAGLARFLKEEGYSVIVATYYDNWFYVDQLLSEGVPYVYVQKAQKGWFRQWHLMRYIRRVNPDIVISYLESPSVRACVAHIFNRHFKLIVSERNTTQNVGLSEKFRFAFFRVADYIVPNSYAQAKLISRFFPKLEDKVVTIPNFVDLHHFVPSEGRVRRKSPHIIIVATIWASKNTLGFLDAVKDLKDKGYRFNIKWYGKDESCLEYFNQCQSKIDQIEIGDCIELKEKTLQIKNCYQDADFFCLPSFYEGTSNVICEAMACGLPILCSDVCDNSLYVKQGENGILFDPHQTSSIVEAFERMFAMDDSQYIAFCQKSREIAKDMLSKEAFIASYLKLIER